MLSSHFRRGLKSRIGVTPAMLDTTIAPTTDAISNAKVAAEQTALWIWIAGLDVVPVVELFSVRIASISTKGKEGETSR